MAEVPTFLAPRAALREEGTDGGRTGDVHGEGDAVAIRLLAPRARFTLRIEPPLLTRAKGTAGFMLALPINCCRAAGGRMAMRLGPDEWQLSGPQSETVHIARELGVSLAGLHHALVDVSHGRVALSVSGPKSADVINSGCALDLSPLAFPVGTSTRTLLGKAEIVLARWESAPGFEIECGRSFAAYVRDFLHEAGRQFRAAN
jgi:sarcosine oxidase subunit gamma